MRTQTQRSTSGIHLAVHGSATIFPIIGSCAAQRATATSTPEAELAALSKGYRTAMLPALDLFDVLCPRSLPPLVSEDNQAAIMVVNSGRNPSYPTMRHLARCQRVDLAWLHERLGVHPDKDRAVLFYEDTRNMSADVYTKSFSNATAWMHAIRLINIFPNDQLNNYDAISEWMAVRKELGNTVIYDDPAQRAKWSKSARSKSKKP